MTQQNNPGEGGQITERMRMLEIDATDEGVALAFPTDFYDRSYADQVEMMADAYDTLSDYCYGDGWDATI